MKAVEPPFLFNADPDAAGGPCEARLALEFTDDQGVTRLTGRRHFGPLRVQKALYPEHPSVCHAVVIHPPGGVVGGDRLRIDVDIGARANALITTPGAAKWYKANGHVSRQQISLRIGAGAALEWLPQETIFFNRADVKLDHHVELAADACYIGAEILCFGRTASGETFDCGRIAQHTSIRRDGRLLWWEQGVLTGEGEAMHSALALDGCTVCATLIAVGAGDRPHPAELIARLRGLQTEHLAAADPGAKTGVTQIKSLLTARYLGHSSAAARAWISACWQQIRPALLARPAIVPRIWHT
ncbi:urease accessory protein UreD [Oxalobacteraceae bacterium CAVE-383]|nr:urease accessory protein UreD [Oxalobacteraceae bacterium CAVE-383]